MDALVEQQHELFIEMLGKVYLPAKACELSGATRATVYKRKKDDELFKARWEDAQAQAVEVLANEARRRAFEGVDKPLMYKGKKVGAVKERSDKLIEFLLSSWDRSTYGRHVKQEHSGHNQVAPTETDMIDLARRIAFNLDRGVRAQERLDEKKMKTINGVSEELPSEFNNK